VLVLQAFTAKAQLTYSWVNQIGGQKGQNGQALAVDPSNNVLVAGTFYDSATFGNQGDPQILNGYGDWDIFVEKLNPGGQLLWARQFGGNGYEDLINIAADPLGNIYLTGYFNDTIRIEGVYTLNATSSSADIFLIKLNPEGQALWAHALGGPYKDEGHSLATDDDGNVYLSGLFSDTVDFNPGAGVFELATKSDQNDMFLLKLNANGQFGWVKHMKTGTEPGSSIGRVLVVKNNHLYAGGYFSGKVDFNPGPAIVQFTAQSDDGFVQKLTLQGDLVWVKQLEGSGTGRVLGLSVDVMDNVFSCGYFSSSIDLDPGAGTAIYNSAGNQGYHDAFFQKLDASGNFVFGKKIGAGSNDQAWGLTTDRSGNMYAIGKFNNTVDFDPGQMVRNIASNGFSDAFVLKLDKNGNFANVARIGGTHFEDGNAIALDQEESVIAVGTFSLTVDFDPGIDTVSVLANGFDGFALKMLQPWDYSGTVYHDMNENGQRDAGEPGLSGVLVEAVNRKVYASTDDAGEYHLYYNLDGDVLRILPKKPYWQLNPGLLPMDTTQSGHITGVVIPEGPDVCIFITEERPFSPGFDTWFQVQVSNIGTEPVYNLPVELILVEQPAGGTFTYLNANIPPDSHTSTMFNWLIDTLQVEQTITYRLRFKTSILAQIGSDFTFSGLAQLDTDLSPANNVSRFTNIIFASYDPNDKQVLPNQLTPEAADTTALTYLIRFQNTGNFPATFVILRDTLSADLDLSTLQIMGASHSYSWRIYGNRILEFRFDNINLPDSTSNEPESHGFAAFAIYPEKGLAIGDKVHNRAGIYFDFNEPVITNWATLMIKNLSSLVSANSPLPFKVYPNPVASGAQFMLTLPSPLEESGRIMVLDTEGKLYFQKFLPTGAQTTHLEGLPSGKYLIWAKSGNRIGGALLMVK
jgi:uncharacterized repeat protein (TIGR01451 family)